MAEWQRFAVHVVGEHCQVVTHLLDRVSVVVDAFVSAVAEGVEDNPFGVGLRFDQIDESPRIPVRFKLCDPSRLALRPGSGFEMHR